MSEGATTRLGWTEEALARLAELRGWEAAALSRLEVGWSEREQRATFTVTDETATPVGHLRYQADPNRRNGERAKMLADAGSARQLFPAPETIANDEPVDGVLVLTEGEPDCVSAWSAGFAAVGVPGVEGWRDEYAVRFTGRRWRVYVVFDCDTQGRDAAMPIVESLIAAGVDARLVDLGPDRDDHYDLTDYLREHGREALRELLDGVEPYRAPVDDVAEVVIEPLRAFLVRELPKAESLVGVTRDGTNLLPRFGWVMPWGREGTAKTTLLVDLLYHVVAGLDWLHYPVERPLRVVAVINEGVPGGMQDKLAQKLERWEGDRDLVLDGLAIYASPWGDFTFREQRLVDHLRAFAVDFEADYVAFDPLHTLGTSGAGSPQETEEFKVRLRAFGAWSDLGVLTAHHSNKLGMVSGDWGRHPDTVLRLEKDGKNAATKLTLEKARPADVDELGVPMLLEWVPETLGFRRVEIDAREHVGDDELLDRVREYLVEHGPTGVTMLKRKVQGDDERVRQVALAALDRDDDRKLVNVARRKGDKTLALPGEVPLLTLSGTQRDADTTQTRMDTDGALSVDPTLNAISASQRAAGGGVECVPPTPFRGHTRQPSTPSETDERDDEPF